MEDVQLVKNKCFVNDAKLSLQGNNVRWLIRQVYLKTHLTVKSIERSHHPENELQIENICKV